MTIENNDQGNSLLDEIVNLPEPEEQPDIELTDDQIENSSVEDLENLFTKKDEEAEEDTPEPAEPPTEKPDEPTDTPDPDLDEEPVDESEDSSTQFTPREKGLYAQKVKYKERAEMMAERLAELERQLDQMKSQPSPDPATVQEDKPDYDPDDFVTVRQVDSLLSDYINRKQQEIIAQQTQVAAQADTIGREFYENYDEVVNVDTFSKLNQEQRQAILKHGTPAKVAKAAYETCKQYIQPNPVTPKSVSPVRQTNRPATPVPHELKPHQISYLQERINNASSQEEIDQIAAELERGGLY